MPPPPPRLAPTAPAAALLLLLLLLPQILLVLTASTTASFAAAASDALQNAADSLITNALARSVAAFEQLTNEHESCPDPENGGLCGNVAEYKRRRKITNAAADGANNMLTEMGKVMSQTDEEIRNDPRFNKAFGKDASSETIQKIRQNVATMASKDATVTTTHRGLAGQDPSGNSLSGGGYNIAGTNKVGFGEDFYKEGTSDGKRAGFYLHEASHALVGTQDKGAAGTIYVGQGDKPNTPHDSYLKHVENSNPDLANIADSYRYFGHLCTGTPLNRRDANGLLYRRAGQACKLRVKDMNKQVAKVSAMNPDGTLNVKATLANAKKTKQSLEATNKQRISGGKAALDFSAKQPKAAKWTAVKDPVTGETTYKKAAPPSAETGSKSKGTREAPKSADGSKIGGKKSPNAAGAASREVSRDKTGASTGKAAKIANGAISKWKLPTVGKSTSHPKKAPAKSKQTKATIKPKTTKKATRPKKQPAKKAPPKRSAPAEKKQTNKAANGKAMMKASGSRKQPPKKISARKGAPATAAKSAPLSRKQNGKKK